MAANLEELAQQFLAAAQKAGADAADVLMVDGHALSIEVRAGALEHAERAEAIDAGLRVIVDGRQASISGSNTDSETITEMAERAVAMAKEAPQDPYCGLADTDQLSERRHAEGFDLADPAEMISAETFQEMALTAEASALKVKGVDQAQAASASASQRRLYLAASNGFGGGYAKTSYGVSCVAIAGQGLAMERDYSGEGRTYFDDLPSPEEIGQLAGERAVARLNPQKPPTGAFPVLFDERVSATLAGHLAAALNGASIVRGSSWLMDALGQQILPKGIDLIEDPLRARVGSSKPFDAEGLPAAKRYLVRDGVLQGWTLDLSTARQLDMDSTASAARGVAGPPSPTTGNLALTQSDKSKDDLIKEMGTGLIVTSMIGSTINPNTGDYSRGAAGLWVENGEVIGPVSGCTIAGNLKDMIKTLTPANDARLHLSRVVPSLLVEGLTIAGE